MEVKSSSSCSTVEADENIILGGNKENPWDFIEKEILEFQSIVKELESYSGKSEHCVWLIKQNQCNSNVREVT